MRHQRIFGATTPLLLGAALLFVLLTWWGYSWYREAAQTKKEWRLV